MGQAPFAGESAEVIPSWYGFILLSLAAWRSWYLLAYDDILSRPRRYVTKVPRSWKEGDPAPRGSRYWLIDWLECPFCSGWWSAIIWYGTFLVWPHGTLIAAVFCALGAGVVAAHKFLSAA